MVKIQFLLFIFLILIVGCGDKMALPPVKVSPTSFGANDTSYIHLQPDWSAATMGYSPAQPMKPVDITIGDDSYIFIADQDNDKIIVVTESGALATTNNMNKISPVVNPVSIDIDAKLNLLIVNGTNTVYVWNQFLNVTGIKRAAFDTTESGELNFTSDQAVLDSILGVHPFYVDANENASFRGVAFGPAEDNSVFITDQAENRILKLRILVGAAVELADRGYLFPVFQGFYEKDIASYGTGAGTVDTPEQITCDDDGNVYFTQLGGNFLVQKLRYNGSTYSAAYTLYEDPIMDLNRFMGPHDIALGLNDAIFILDTADSGRVSKFYNRGSFAGKPANLGKKGLVDARFNHPLGIAISSTEVVYIANTDDHLIERYQFSVSEDDLPQEPQ